MQQNKSPLVSVIIPTYNSAGNLKLLLESLTKSENKNFEIIINDDKRTNDETSQIIEKFIHKMPIIYIHENRKMAQARKKWAEYANGNILFHVDSDMQITEGLIGEIIEKMEDYDALIVNEESFWTTFRAKCKWLEKRCYRGIREIESLRVVKKEVYQKLWGHDEKMVFSEDKDFDIRVGNAWYKVWRVETNFLWHNEWDLKLWRTLKKKQGYSHTANIFAAKHSDAYRWQINIFNRYWIYLKNIKYLFRYPLVYLWMIRMKTCEFVAGGLGVVFSMISK